MKFSRSVSFFLVFILGLTGLGLEVCWQRFLSLTLGSTVFASTTVIASFLGGMAAGSFFLTGYIRKKSFPLILSLGIIEIILGTYVFLFPYLLHLNLGKFILGFIALLLPNALMGAMFPLLTEIIYQKEEKKDFGMVYAINTFGGVAGSLLTGFILIKYLGLAGTNNLLAGINLIIGLVIVFKILSKADLNPIFSHSSMSSQSKTPPLFLLIFFLSGFLSLGAEVIFTRILVFFIYNHTYSFTIILITFLSGIFAGSYFISRRLTFGLKRNMYALGLMAVGVGSVLPLSILFVDKVYYFNRFFSPYSWLGLLLGRFIPPFILMFVPAFLMGMILPLGAAAYLDSGENAYGKIGKLYALNNLGSLCGAYCAGFFFIPLFGIRNSLLSLALIYVVCGLGVISLEKGLGKKEKRLSLSFAGIIGSIIIMILISVPTPLSLSARIIFPESPQNQLLYYKEGKESAVTVIEDVSKVRKLYVDAHQAANESRWDAPSHKIIGHIPAFLHPQPKKGLIIGFGMGLTSRALILNNVAVEAVEISREVVEANTFFYRINERIPENPLLKITIADGRNFVRNTSNKYDLINVGIIHPMINAGSAGFYTHDFYEECKSILNEGGVVSQWVPLHSVPPEGLRMIVRSFLRSFPNSTLWYKFTSDFFLLVSTPQQLKIDYPSLVKRMNGVYIAQDLKDVDMESPVALLDSFMMGPENLRKYAGDGPLHTDDRPYLDFFSPAEKEGTAYYNLKALQPYRESVIPYVIQAGQEEIRDLKNAFEATQHTIIGQLYYLRSDFISAVREFQVGLKINPGDNNLKFLRDELVYNIKMEGGKK